MTAYLAPACHYSRLLAGEAMPHDTLLLSRCRILTPAGQTLTLSIPLRRDTHNRHDNPLVSEHGNWRHRHWNALRSAYGRSPYFQFYADDFAPFYQRQWTRLQDLNEALHLLVCQLLGIPDTPQETHQGQDTPRRPCPHPDLSIVDLLFREGPESVLYL
ncbi:MAG: WbqC family protein [Prevotellaceae bacterium]|nr:WbqC family protein [Prevotellaceae bacterium]